MQVVVWFFELHSVRLFVGGFSEGVLTLGFFIGVRPCCRSVSSFFRCR